MVILRHRRADRPARRSGRSGWLAPLLLLLTACSLGSNEPGGSRQAQPTPTATVPDGTVASGPPATSSGAEEAAVVGMWTTADGEIRQELLPGGRYEEARGDRERAYTGQYWVTGDHIDYLDDTGFTATGDIRDGVLHHGGWEFFREGDPRNTGR